MAFTHFVADCGNSLAYAMGMHVHVCDIVLWLNAHSDSAGFGMIDTTVNSCVVLYDSLDLAMVRKSSGITRSSTVVT